MKEVRPGLELPSPNPVLSSLDPTHTATFDSRDIEMVLWFLYGKLTYLSFDVC